MSPALLTNNRSNVSYLLQNKNYKQSTYLIFLTMIYMSIVLCSGVLTHRIVKIGPIYTMGGTLVAPLWFIVSDVITEVYGYRTVKNIIWFGFVCQALFAIACYLIVRLPSPDFLVNQSVYFTVLGSTLHTCLSAFVAYIFAGFINSYLISKWKILLKGRHFWLRCLGASTISELIFTVTAVSLIQYNKLPVQSIFHIILVSYTLKIIYAIILAYPAALIAALIKKADGIDTYDYQINYNPLLFLNLDNNKKYVH